MKCFTACSLILGILAAGTLAFAPSLRADEVGELRARYAAQFEAVAKKCEELTRDRDVDLTEQARTTRNWLAPRDPRRQYVFVPAMSPPPARRRVETALHTAWRDKFTELRTAYADELFEQARRIHAAGDDARAYRLLHEVLREDPQHASAREMLRPVNWTAAIRVTRGRADDSTLAWRRGGYWQVETPHFEIVTNIASGGDARAMAERLEHLYAVWLQLFYEYWIDDARGKLSFVGETAPRLETDRRHRVVVFREKQEYVVRLNALGASGAGQSSGYYSDALSRSFFYAGDEQTYGTWYHETTHQLFHETGKVVDDVARDGHIWLVEGVAIYMESLQPFDGYVTVGGFDAARLQYARQRRLVDRFYVPLADLTSINREQLAKHENISFLYSECGGLAHFLMDGADGKYRRGTIDTLKAIYAGRATLDALSRLTGADFTTIDEQYPVFLADVDDEDLTQFLSPPERITELALPKTQVTDEGVARLSAYHNLQWLDLTETKASDDSVRRLGELRRLERLGLQGTAITDAALDAVGRMQQLNDLNLAHTAVTDRGLLQLRDLRNLTALLLENTAVGDAGVAAISRLGKLEYLDLAATKVTDAGLASIGQLRNLGALYLSRTDVSDAGLISLRRLNKEKIELIQLDGTRVTSEGASALKAALPKTRIILGPAAP